MRARRLLGLRMVLILALAGAAAVALWPRSSRVTRENFERIRKGMSRGEVEAILGTPGDYRTFPTDDKRHHYWGVYAGNRAIPNMSGQMKYETWKGDAGGHLRDFLAGRREAPGVFPREQGATKPACLPPLVGRPTVAEVVPGGRADPYRITENPSE
jgi:hypothetical protein